MSLLEQFQSSTVQKRFVLYFSSFFVLIAVPYSLINAMAQHIQLIVIEPKMVIDDMIPFVPFSIIAYASLYLYYPFFAYILARDEQSQIALSIYEQFLLMTYVAFSMFIILPTKVTIRTNDQESIFSSMYEFLHAIDLSYNSFPSLHVAHSLFIVFATHHLMSKHPLWTSSTTIFMSIGLVLLVFSTMTTKQHYVFDVVTGAALAIVFWRLWLSKQHRKV